MSVVGEVYIDPIEKAYINFEEVSENDLPGVSTEVKLDAINSGRGNGFSGPLLLKYEAGVDIDKKIETIDELEYVEKVSKVSSILCDGVCENTILVRMKLSIPNLREIHDEDIENIDYNGNLLPVD